ncbi:Uncharacterized protein BP5553_01125 [Venustampulla echinocandica]|uniref:Uncharacterized protein n=1 Tax=Venustampulla echinocandica TaxID=2656787 RepID=A0A370U038_9HELO|nr:Uncharacterized protein BP5553_01125 [Venustampulla echinocandica]RDL41146.1 Uncharacterized protein BP5553_01125 [Venustampulla echinocandica]
MATTPDQLFSIKRTIIDYLQDESGATRYIDILGTYSKLDAAKAAARTALTDEGYIKDDFPTYDENDGKKQWTHGDGVIVFAKMGSGQELLVAIETTPNTHKLKGDGSGRVDGQLYYVLQTTINYDADRSGAAQTTEIEGIFADRHAAEKVAKHTLLAPGDDIKRKSYAEYDDKAAFKGEWPYGDDCFVHAVSNTGQNFIVKVKTQPHSHGNHSCKHHEGGRCECKCWSHDGDIGNDDNCTLEVGGILQLKIAKTMYSNENA